jgi:hypothetical protein
MPVDCNNPKNNQEQALCSCKQATDTFTKSYDDYNKKYNEYKSDLDSYNRWVNKHEDWKALRGDFKWIADKKSNLANEHKEWNNCVAWNETQSGKHSDWCNNENYGWEHVGQSGGGCWPGFGKGVCARTSWRVDQEIQGDISNSEPKADPQDSSKYWLGMPVPQPPQQPNGTNIMCCSQIFSDINVKDGNANISNISQNCSLQLEQQLSKSTSTAASLPTTSTPTTTSTPATTGTSTPGTPSDTQTTLIFMVLLIVLLLCFSISLGFAIRYSE